jgi:glycine dehydrogenase subunit 1
MRYLPHTEADIEAMLNVIGVATLDELFTSIPEACRSQAPLNLPPAMSEWQLDAHMEKLAGSMATSPQYKVFMGAGSYEHFIPASIRYLLGRSEFSTAYTPYQPEISQGTLQAIYEFQTYCARLLGMDIATASHYDGATALAEAILISIRKTGRKKVAVSRLIHPLHRQVLDSYLRPISCELLDMQWKPDGKTGMEELENRNDLAAIVIQSPNFFGCIEDLQSFSAIAKKQEVLFIVSFTEPLAYGLLKNPGSQGADLVAGDGQSFGIPRSFGGPGLGIIASASQFMRNLPGRLVGQTVDLDGEEGFVLTLSTREQHIRREKATSNICSNNGLCAVAATMYLASLGGSGFRELSALNHNKSEYLKQQLQKAEVAIPFSSHTFNEFVVDLGKNGTTKYKKLLGKNIVAGLPLEKYFPELAGHYLYCVTEVMTKADLDMLVEEVTLS